MRRFFKIVGSCVIGCLLCAASLPGNVRAAYPDRPVTIIIPFGPGGAVDIAARILAEWFQTQRGITLNIVCKGGGAGAPAMLDVAKARPDGYTFGFPALATFSTTPQVKKTGYTLKDFQAVAQITNMWLSLAVSADSEIMNFNDLLAAARANPGKINFATHGALSSQRLFMSGVLKKFPDVQLPHVAYTSGHEVSTALLGKHIVSGFGVVTNQKPYVQSGDFRIIGVTSPKRLPEYPDVPTFAEQIGEEFVFPSPHGLITQRKVPHDKVIIMQNLIKDALADKGVQEKFEKAGLSVDYLPAAEFQTEMDNMWKIVGELLKASDTLK